MSELRPLGHFHGDDTQVCLSCCDFGTCQHPDGAWEFTLSDIGHGNVGPVCGVCGQPLCTDEELEQARRDADAADYLEAMRS